jgi:alpha-amylase
MKAGEKVRFIFGIHNHQPVGNFPEVFERAAERAYDPLLAALTRHPGVRAVVHYSGCLLEWMESSRPVHLDGIHALAARDQIEILSGGFYEPILPLIPPGDREGQIRLQTRYIKDRFGATARGMWLAERVWEPGLAADLHRAGIAYTLLDDYHFLGSLDEDPVGGYYLTEECGNPVGLFPICEALRYLIPFREPEETIRYLFERRGRGEVVVMVDDGEKFGLWPDTYKWVHEGGWLERFFTAIESAQQEGWLMTTTFSEAADSLRPRGRVYLPPSSYFEMTEWSLPPAKRLRFEETARRLREKREWEPMRSFLRGGFFRSYMARYPEARRSVSRGRVLSRRLDALDGAEARRGVPSEARRHLWRSQCNCGYWHGLFGGLYLPHIRRGVQESLARATAAVREAEPGGAGIRVEIAFVDDLEEREVAIETDDMSLLVQPSAGGALAVCDFPRRPVALGCTLTRRHEAYHDAAREASSTAAAAGVASAGSPPADGRINIHERRPEASPDLQRHLVSDLRERLSLIERFLPEGSTPEDLMEVKVADLSRGEDACRLEVVEEAGSATLVLRRGIRLAGPSASASEISFDLIKEIRVRSGREGWTAAFRAAAPGDLEGARGFLLGVEINLSLIESSSRVVLEGVPPRGVSEPWSEANVSTARIHEEHRGFSASLSMTPGGSLWHHPVRTVSRSEAGFELIYQGSAFIFVWPLHALVRGEVAIGLEMEDLRRSGPVR